MGDTFIANEIFSRTTFESLIFLLLLRCSSSRLNFSFYRPFAPSAIAARVTDSVSPIRPWIIKCFGPLAIYKAYFHPHTLKKVKYFFGHGGDKFQKDVKTLYQNHVPLTTNYAMEEQVEDWTLRNEVRQWIFFILQESNS